MKKLFLLFSLLFSLTIIRAQETPPTPGTNFKQINPAQFWYDFTNNKVWLYRGNSLWLEMARKADLPIITVSNGLTKTGDNIALGGDYGSNILVGGANKGSLQLTAGAAFMEYSGANYYSQVTSSYTDVNVGLSSFGNWANINISTNDGIKITDELKSRGMFYNFDYSSNWTNDALYDNYLTNKKYVDSKFSTIDLSNYVTKTGVETLTNKTLSSPDINNGNINNANIVNGSINNTPIGGGVPNTGLFTNLNATSSSTIALKTDIATGQTIGANTTGRSDNSLKWNAQDYIGDYSGETLTRFMIGTSTQGEWIGALPTTTRNLLGLGDGSDLNNVASNSTKWNGESFDGNANTNPQTFMAYDGNTFQWRPTTATQTRTALGLLQQDFSAYTPTIDAIVVQQGAIMKPSTIGQVKTALATSLQDAKNVNPLIEHNGTASYGVQIVGTSTLGSPSDLFLVGQSGFSNGLTIRYDGTKMAYNFASGDIAVPNGNITANNLLSGTYTPTITGLLNATSLTANQCFYTRVGNNVTISGSFGGTLGDISTNSAVSISLPSGLGSDFTTASDATGNGALTSFEFANVFAQADSGTDLPTIYITPISNATRIVHFKVTYIIK